MRLLLAITFLAASLPLASAQKPAGKPKAKAKTLGDDVVAFCEKNIGAQVGNGQCAVLAGEALKEAGAEKRGKDHPNDGDYTWGSLVFLLETTPKGPRNEGKAKDILPGDIVQFRDVKTVTRTVMGNRTYTYTATFPHHTAVVRKVADNGLSLAILHQNTNGNKTVQEGVLLLNTITEGWVRIYRPVK